MGPESTVGSICLRHVVWSELCLNLVAISGTGGTGRDWAYMVRSLLQSLLSALLRSRLSALLSALKMAPKRFEYRYQNGSETVLESILGVLGENLELFWLTGRLWENSWNALRALLDAFGAQKSNWKRLLDGPRPPRRLVSALPGGQIPSQKEPRRVPNRGPKTIRAENSKTLIFNDSCKDFNDF